MLREIIINSTPFEKRIAILEEGKLVELIIENAEHQKILANIYKGRIQTVLPGLQSAFVDIGLAKSAFLHISHINTSDSVPIESRPHRSYKGGTKKMRIQDILKEGQEILVQIVKEPISTKGAKVTTSLSLPGRFLVLLSDSNFVRVSKKIHNRAQRNMLKRLIYEIKPSNIGFIVRTIGQHVSEEEFRIEIRKLLKKWNDIQKLAAKSKAPTLVYKDEEPALGIIRDLFSDDVHSVVMDSPSDYKAIHDYLKNLSPELLSKV
ncbi:MAG: ribonuclease E/G, partial [Elusimicrobiota bacterium]